MVSSQKKNKSSKSAPEQVVLSTEPVALEPVVVAPEPVVLEPVVVATEPLVPPLVVPVEQKVKKVKKSKVVSEPVSEPVLEPVSEPVLEPVLEPVSEPVLEPVAPSKKSKAKVVKSTGLETNVLSTVVSSDVLPKTKKVKASKVVVAKDVVLETTPDLVLAPVEEADNTPRSFKVLLPGEQDYLGRFTGLTPYQAANKALSKFFRNSENNNLSAEHVLFSIKESTRGSKRATYTYKGARIKLETPITYTIKSASGEERVITKQYKNQLVKVKKGVTEHTETENVVVAV